MEDSKLLEVLGVCSGGYQQNEFVMIDDDYGRKIRDPNSVEDN